MRKPIIPLFISVSIFLIACGNNTNESSAAIAIDSPSMNMTDTVTEKTYDLALMDNKKDPTCGMPVTAGVSDTVQYKSKVLGFCSSECKAEFLKNPAANIAAAELK